MYIYICTYMYIYIYVYICIYVYVCVNICKHQWLTLPNQGCHSSVLWPPILLGGRQSQPLSNEMIILWKSRSKSTVGQCIGWLMNRVFGSPLILHNHMYMVYQIYKCHRALHSFPKGMLVQWKLHCHDRLNMLSQGIQSPSKPPVSPCDSCQGVPEVSKLASEVYMKYSSNVLSIQ